MIIETKKQLRKELDEYCEREATLFSELYDIEKILEKGEEKHEMAIITLNKIKKRINQRYQH